MIVCFRNGRPSGRADAIFASSREARRLVDFKFSFSELESQILKYPCNLNFKFITSLLLFVILCNLLQSGREDAQKRSWKQVFFPSFEVKIFNF